MLIIAIPKSASTSLMLTLGKYHNIEAKQDFSFSENKKPENCTILFKLHSDIRELTKENVAQLSNPKTINKQHVYPSPNNLSLLTGKKKVILRRSPDEIILAYRRETIRLGLNFLSEFSTEMTDKEWLERSKENGLYSDLTFFYEEWEKQANPDNTIFINYEEYVENPTLVFNKIEKFYDLPLTKEKVKTVKARYTRRSSVNNLFHKVKNKLKLTIKWFLTLLGLKDKFRRMIKKS